MTPGKTIALTRWTFVGKVMSLVFNTPSCCYSVAQLCPTVYNPTNCITPVFPVLHYLPEFAQTHIHWVGDAIQPAHSLSSPFPPVLNLSQHQGLFQWVGSSHQVANVLELQHQSFQWIFWFDFLSVQFSSVAQLRPTLYDLMEGSTPGLPVLYYFTEFAQTHIHWVGDANQPSNPLSSLSPPAINLSQHQGLLQWVGSSHQVAQVSELQL